MKCPICNRPMKQATYDYNKADNDETLYMSIMPCDCVCNYGASRKVWQELIRTRKALDVAVDALKRTDWCAQDYAIAQEALNKITALEQKD